MPVRDRFGPLMEGREGLRAKNAKSSVASKYGVELFESEGAEHGITEGREGDVEKEQRWNRIIEREEEEGRRESYLPLSRLLLLPHSIFWASSYHLPADIACSFYGLPSCSDFRLLT